MSRGLAPQRIGGISGQLARESPVLLLSFWDEQILHDRIRCTYSNCVCMKEHFFVFSFSPAACNLWRILRRLVKCSCIVHPTTKMSSRYTVIVARNFTKSDKFRENSVRIPQSFCAANCGIAVLLPQRVSPISAE